jgi:hypothetical protein
MDRRAGGDGPCLELPPALPVRPLPYVIKADRCPAPGRATPIRNTLIE